MDENKTFRCNVPGCEKAFWFKSALTRHMSKHVADDPDAPTVSWGCSECTKLFSKVESLRRHYRTTHGNVYVYSCAYEGCNQMFQRKDNLIRHSASHNENKNICDICGKSFARRDALMRHKTIHTRKAQLAKAAEQSNSPTHDQQSTNNVQMWALKCDKMLYDKKEDPV